MVGACRQMGVLEAMNERSQFYEPVPGRTAEMYDVGLYNEREWRESHQPEHNTDELEL